MAHGLRRRRRPHWRLIGLATASLLALAAAATAQATIPGSPVSSETHATATKQVPTLLPGLTHATYLGPATPGTFRTIGVALARPDPAGEERVYEELYNPASPSYHQFLTPESFQARFGVPAAETQAVTGWLRQGGLTIETVATSGDYVTATGTAAQLNRLFSVRIGRYRIGNVTFLANDRAPSVPVSSAVSAVVGLDTLHKFAVPASITNRRAATAKSSTTRPTSQRSSVAAGSFSGVLEPRDLWGAYDMPATDLGQGQVIGVFGNGQTDSVITQLRLFEQHERFPKVPVRVVRTEPGDNAAYGDNSGNVEWYLDVQAATGMSPDVSRLDLYFSRSLFDADVFASFETWADDPAGPAQMNASFGECETNPTNPVTGPLGQLPYGTGLGDELEPVGEPILRKATLEGRTVFSASGDTGSGCPAVVAPVLGPGNGAVIQPVPIVDYPSSSRYAVGVGGTVLTTDGFNHGLRQSEVSWTFTGGGSSGFFAEPAFQRRVAAVNHPCISHADGRPYARPTTCRGVPDVAALSGNITSNAYFIYIDGSPASQGGTSLSGPLVMGMWARLQAAAPTAGGLGFADEAFYGQVANKTTYERDFFDVTAAETPLGNGLYRPGPGWDYTSGLGVPDVGHLLDDIDHRRVARAPAPAPEGAPLLTCAATMVSPAGNATDPVAVQFGNDGALDITSATLALAADHKHLVATVTGPHLSAMAHPDGTGGHDLYVLWSYRGTEWFAQGHFDSVGLLTVESGNTDSGSPTPNPNTAATGTLRGNKLTMTVPLAEVGKPPPGSLLAYPFAMSQLDVGLPNVAGSPFAGLALTVDTASSPRPTLASRGQALLLGGSCPAPA